MWKKRKDIEGVSESSIVGLKAVLFQKEQEAKRFKTTGEARPRARKKAKETVWTKQNKGISERARRDEQALQAEQKTTENVEAKLQEKARLYEQFVSGGLAEDAEEGKFLVDFEKKSWDKPGQDGQQEDDSEFYHGDIQREEERKRWERNAAKEMEDEEAALSKKQKDLEVLDKVIAQTRQGRDKARVLKERRKQKAQERLEKIKQREEQMKKLKEMGEKGEKELIIQIEEEAEEERLARERMEKEKEERERREKERKERQEREAKEREEMQQKKREEEEKRRADKQKKKDEFLASNPLFAPPYSSSEEGPGLKIHPLPSAATQAPTPVMAAQSPLGYSYPGPPGAYYPPAGYGAYPHGSQPVQQHYPPAAYPTATTTAPSAASFSPAAAADDFLARLMSEQQGQQDQRYPQYPHAAYGYYPQGTPYGYPPGAYAYPPAAEGQQQTPEQQQQYARQWADYYSQNQPQQQ